MGNYFGSGYACVTGSWSYNAFEGGSIGCGSTNSINGSYLSSCFADNNDNPTDPSATTAGDWHLNAGCALIGAGNSGDFPTTDQDGHTRSSPPSIGAYVSTAQE